MSQEEYSGYIGWFKQPLTQPRNSKPTMYMVADHQKQEMDLALLTPGCFLEAYHCIKAFGSVKTRLFIPSLRMEWISDIFNLYMSTRDIIDIKWIFPNRSDHDSFEDGHLLESFHLNEFDESCGMGYVPNEHIPDVYDIEIHDSDGIHYFSQYLTKEKLDQLIENDYITDIHLPHRSTIYGGENYRSLYLTCPGICRSHIIPHSFLSVEEWSMYQSMPNVKRGKVINYDSI